MTYPEIQPDEIRKGDKIRAELLAPSSAGDTAREYVAAYDVSIIGWGATYYLLDRPTPPVDLPTDPTVGVVTWKYDDSKVTQSETALWNLTEDGLCFRSESSSIPVAFVIDFAPIRVLADDATAVPTSALHELRTEVTKRLGCASVQCKSLTMAKTFLAAVDEANA